MYRKITALLLSLALILSGVWTIPNTTAHAEGTFANRICGQSESQTIVEISKAGWPAGSENVVLASIENFPDALAGAPFAYLKNAPILLTSHNSLDIAVSNEIKRLQAKHIFILGGPGAVSEEVVDALVSIGCDVQRIYGDDRYKTAIEIGKNIQSDTVVIATGENYPDALAIGPFAAKKQYPILFTEKDSLNSDTKKVLSDWHIKNALIVGGDGVISQAVYEEIGSMGISVYRLAGSDRYRTAFEIIKYFSSGGFSGIYAATGEDFPDALAGGPLAAKKNYPIFMVGKDYVDSDVLRYIKGLNLKAKTYVLGNTEAVSDETANKLIAWGETQDTGVQPGEGGGNPAGTGDPQVTQKGEYTIKALIDYFNRIGLTVDNVKSNEGFGEDNRTLTIKSRKYDVILFQSANTIPSMLKDYGAVNGPLFLTFEGYSVNDEVVVAFKNYNK